MRRIAGIVVALAVVLGGLLAPATAQPTQAPRVGPEVVYRDVGFDPMNRRLRFMDYRWMDVRKSMRALVRVDGHQVVRVGLWSRRDFPVPWRYIKYGMDDVFFHTYLDTRGDHRWDHRIYSRSVQHKGSRHYCAVANRRHPDAWKAGMHAWVSDTGALWCAVPANTLHITKSISWWVKSRSEDYYSGLAPGSFADRAPDTGRYS
jgi:hypothetical protein